MNHEVRNVTRLWVDKDSTVVVRHWTTEEHASVNPDDRIYEKHWSWYCPQCRTVPAICGNRDDAKHYAYRHEFLHGHRHRCKVKYRDHELICLEFKEEYSPEFDVWVAKQTLY